MKKSLVLFSGGMDSTYVLWKMLTETDDEITAVTLRKAEGSPERGKNWFATDREYLVNIPDVVNELKKIRTFTHTFKDISEDDVTEENEHYYVFLIDWAVSDLNSGKYDRIVSGRTWEQYEQNILRNPKEQGTYSTIAANRLFDMKATRGELWNPLVTHDFHDKFCRWHVMKYLPSNLQKLSVSCHEPKVVDNKLVRCGECNKCLWDDKVKELIELGWNAKQVNTWRYLKSLQYGGGGNKTAPMRLWLPVEMKRGKIMYELDTKEKIANHVQTRKHYTVAFRQNKGIWKFD